MNRFQRVVKGIYFSRLDELESLLCMRRSLLNYAVSLLFFFCFFGACFKLGHVRVCTQLSCPPLRLLPSTLQICKLRGQNKGLAVSSRCSLDDPKPIRPKVSFCFPTISWTLTFFFQNKATVGHYLVTQWPLYQAPTLQQTASHLDVLRVWRWYSAEFQLQLVLGVPVSVEWPLATLPILTSDLTDKLNEFSC